MKNPWLKIPTKPPYILKEDIEIINNFNKKVKIDHQIFINLLTEPFCGDPFKAKIFLLQLNPGIDNPTGFYDDKDDFAVLNIPDFKNDSYKILKHEKLEYPFTELNPKYRLYGGFRYWADKFSPFINSKEDYKKIANKVCCLEFFPYHSKNYRDLGTILECQKYNFELLEKAIKRGAIVILMRGKRQWLSNVPSLKKYKYIALGSNRNVILSKANLGKNFDEIRKVLG